MAEKAKGKRIPLQPGGRMLLGLSDEIQAMPYEDREKIAGWTVVIMNQLWP